MKTLKKNLMRLPVFDDCCTRVDTTSEMFIECVRGKIVKSRSGSSFTLGFWNDHKNDTNNLNRIELLIKGYKIFEEQLKKGDKWSNLDKNWNNNI